MKTIFSEDSKAGKDLLAWWENLREARGARAELRRCKSPDEVAITASFQRLCHRLRPAFAGESGWEGRLAAIAGLAAQVHETTPGRKLAVAMTEGNTPAVSELRFRRLLQRERADLYPALIRILRMLGNKADILDLADSVYYWGKGVKKRWAADYFPRVPEKRSA